jgi:O-antigen ligase
LDRDRDHGMGSSLRFTPGGSRAPLIPMAVTSPPGRRIGSAATSVIPGVQPFPGSPTLPPERGSTSGPHDGPPSRVARFVPRETLHNVWMVVLLIVIVGKVGDWAPVIAGLPVLKIAFVVAALYVNRVWGAYEPVRVSSLAIARLAIAFFILSIVSIFFSILKSVTLDSIYLSVIYLISFVLLVKTTQTQKDVERLLIGLAVAGCSLSIAELIDFHGGRARLSGTNSNDLAYSIVTLLPIVLALRGRAWRWRHFFATMLAVAMCMAVLLTASRGGAVGLLAVLLAVSVFPLALTNKGELKRRNVAAVVFALAFVALAGKVMFGYLPETTQLRLLTLVHPDEDYNTSTTLNASRRVIWLRDLRLALERPIGYGMNTATAVDGIYGHGQYRTAHNSVIQAFVELGAFGLYLYLASYFVAWRELGRISGARQRDGPTGAGAKAALYARALRLALLGNFTAGFFLSQAYSASLWMILALCCAFIRITAANNDLTVRQSPRASSGWRRPRTST